MPSLFATMVTKMEFDVLSGDSIMADPKITINRTLYDLLGKLADERGYSSAEEFVIHLLETAVADAGPSTTEEEIRERLRGLGYLA